MENSNEKGDLKLVSTGAIVLLGLTILAVIVAAVTTDIFSEFPYLLPVLIGLIAFTTMIFTVLYGSRVSFALNMGSPAHAFGMPPGSIRAILALGFMVLVLIIGVFTITTVRDQDRPVRVSTFVVEQPGQLDAQREKVADQYGKDFTVVAVPESVGEKARIDVFIPAGDNRAVTQLSQQVLTMVATALTAIVGFYFGSRTANEPEATQKADRRRRIQELTDSVRTRVDEIHNTFEKLGGEAAFVEKMTTKGKNGYGGKYKRLLAQWLDTKRRLSEETGSIELMLSSPEIDGEFFTHRRALLYRDLDRYVARWAKLETGFATGDFSTLKPEADALPPDVG